MEFSNCTEIPQDVDEEIFFQPPPWLAFLVVFIGIVVTIIVVLVLYGCRVFIWKILVTYCCCPVCCCACCVCCCACCGAAGKTRDKHSSTVSLAESGMPLLSSTSLQTTSFADLRAGEVIENAYAVTNQTLYVADIEEEDDESDAEGGIGITMITRRESKYVDYQKSLAFSDLFCLSNKETALFQLYSEDKKLLSNLVYSFLDELSSVFCLCVRHLAQHVVAAEIKGKVWKQEVESIAKESFAKARNGWDFDSMSALVDDDMWIADSLQVDLYSVTMAPIDHICKTLENVNPVEEKMASTKLADFLNSWAVLQQVQARLNLSQVKQLKKDLMLRKQILVAIYDERADLFGQIGEYRERQLTQLDNVHTDVHADKVQETRTNIHDLWESTLASFKAELTKESSALSRQMQNKISAEENESAQNLEQSMTQKRDFLLKSQLSLQEFTRDYSESMTVYMHGKFTRKALELKLIGSQFSAIVEYSGAAALKNALEAEKRMYRDFLQRTSGVSPQISQSIKGNKARLIGFKASLKKLREEQRSNLQVLIKSKVSQEVDSDTFCGAEIIKHQTSLKEVVVLQTDLCDIDCEHLVDQCLARLRIFEAQLELSKLGQERRLDELFELKKAELNRTLKKETNKASPGSDAVVTANVKFQLEEKKLQSSLDSAQAELKSKLMDESKYTLLSDHFLFQNQIEKLRRKQEKQVTLASKRELAINAVKSELLNKLSGISRQDIGERILRQHQVELDLLSQTINKTKDHQNQVLIQKLQARKLEKKKEKDIELKQQQPPPNTYRPGSAKSFVSTVFVNLLHSVRHKRDMEALEAELQEDEKRSKINIVKRFEANAKSELQVHETEVIIKLASALNMTHSELERDLKNSVIEQNSGTDQETCSLVTKSVLDLLSNAY